MNQKLKDTCEEIRVYITTNKNDDCSSWEYQHTPYLEEILSNLNEIETHYLSKEIFSWSEFHLYELADPIILCTNQYLNADLLYIKIFIQIKNIEYLGYLVENVIHNIRPPYYTLAKIKDWETEEIFGLIENTSTVKEVKGEGWESLKEVIDFLKTELTRRENTKANKT